MAIVIAIGAIHQIAIGANGASIRPLIVAIGANGAK